jgi:hypothetical protein
MIRLVLFAQRVIGIACGKLTILIDQTTCAED